MRGEHREQGRYSPWKEGPGPCTGVQALQLHTLQRAFLRAVTDALSIKLTYKYHVIWGKKEMPLMAL